MKLSVGFNWQTKLIKELGDLNKRYTPNIVEEVYASLPDDPFGSAREKGRLGQQTFNEVKKAIAVAKDNNIAINYLLNSPTITPFHKKEVNIARKYLERLVKLGIDSFTVAAPFLIDNLHAWFGSIKIDISSVANVSSIEEIRFYTNRCIRRIKLPIDLNRDFKFIEVLKSEYGTPPIELIVNECCLLHCPMRAHHLIVQGLTYYGRTIPSDYPYSWCFGKMFPKGLISADLLKAPWIRPVDIARYEKYGLEHFKITGRTMPVEWITKTTETYLARCQEVDLVTLFPIVPGELRFEGSKRLLPKLASSKLDNLIDHFENSKPECRLSCGKSCRYCDSFQQIAKT